MQAFRDQSFDEIMIISGNVQIRQKIPLASGFMAYINMHGPATRCTPYMGWLGGLGKLPCGIFGPPMARLATLHIL